MTLRMSTTINTNSYLACVPVASYTLPGQRQSSSRVSLYSDFLKTQLLFGRHLHKPILRCDKLPFVPALFLLLKWLLPPVFPFFYSLSSSSVVNVKHPVPTWLSLMERGMDTTWDRSFFARYLADGNLRRSRDPRKGFDAFWKSWRKF